ncbi:MAG: sigma-70 family RNA polymerase sigma factor [Myxococcota bacterium]
MATPFAATSAPGRPTELLVERVRDAARGDVAAQRDVLRAVAPGMLAAARRVLGPSAADVDDAAQDALVKVAAALPGLRDPGAVQAFATRAAVRRALRVRAQRRVVPLEEVGPRLAAGDDPSRQLAAKERIELLLDLLEELPEAQAETLALRYCLGHSIDQVATLTEVSAHTVRSRIRLGRAALARKLSKRGPVREALRESLGSPPTHEVPHE